MNNHMSFAQKDTRVTSMPRSTPEGMYSMPGSSPPGFVMPVQNSPMLGFSGPPSREGIGVQVVSGSTSSSTLVGAPTMVNGVPMQAVGTYMPKGFVPVNHSPNVQASPTTVGYQSVISPPGGSLYNSTGGLNSINGAGFRKSVSLYGSNPGGTLYGSQSGGALYGSHSGRDSATLSNASPQQPGTMNQQVVGSYFLVPQQQRAQQQAAPKGTADNTEHHHANAPRPVTLNTFMVQQAVPQTMPQQEASTEHPPAEAQRSLPPQMQPQPLMMQAIAPQQQPMVLQQRPVSGLPQTPPSAPQQNSDLLHPKEHENKRYMAMHMVPVVPIQYQQQQMQIQAQELPRPVRLYERRVCAVYAYG